MKDIHFSSEKLLNQGSLQWNRQNRSCSLFLRLLLSQIYYFSLFSFSSSSSSSQPQTVDSLVPIKNKKTKDPETQSQKPRKYKLKPSYLPNLLLQNTSWTPPVSRVALCMEPVYETTVRRVYYIFQIINRTNYSSQRERHTLKKQAILTNSVCWAKSGN